MSSPTASSPLSACSGPLATTNYVNDLMATVHELTQATAALEQRLVDTEARIEALEQMGGILHAQGPHP